MSTKRDSVRVLLKSVLTRLETQKAIIFPVRQRQVIQDELYVLVGAHIKTDEDLRLGAIEKIGANAALLEDSTFTDSDQFRSAKAVVRASFGDDVLNGFYFLKPLKVLSESIVQYMMRSSHIEDVFDSDEDLQKKIIEVIHKFNPDNAH